MTYIIPTDYATLLVSNRSKTMPEELPELGPKMEEELEHLAERRGWDPETLKNRSRQLLLHVDLSPAPPEGTPEWEPPKDVWD
jgi:hypothetical protein